MERKLNSNSEWQTRSVLYIVIIFYFITVILELVMQGALECGRKLSMKIRLSQWEKKKGELRAVKVRNNEVTCLICQQY